MYEKFFGLRERPFELVPDPRFLVMTAGHREALSNLEYGIASRKGITLLLGEAGLGKTTLIRAALQQNGERVHCVYLPNPALTRAEFVEMLATKFDLGPHARESKAALLNELEGVLRERHGKREVTLLVIDEAQSLSIELLEEIRLLANFETDQQKLVSLILAGQPELSQRLNDPSLRQLKQRIALRCQLHALDLRETAAYLAGRIKAAGGVGAQVFTRDAVMAIHEKSGGIPRVISVLADNALVSGFALQERPVTRDRILDVCQDFDIATATMEGDAAPVLQTPSAAAAREAGQAAAPAAAASAPLLVREAPPVRDHTPRGAMLLIDGRGAVEEPVSEAAAAAAPRRRLFGIF